MKNTFVGLAFVAALASFPAALLAETRGTGETVAEAPSGNAMLLCQADECPPTDCTVNATVLLIPDGKQRCINFPRQRAVKLCTRRPLVARFACEGKGQPVADALCPGEGCVCAETGCTFVDVTGTQVGRNCHLTCEFRRTGSCMRQAEEEL